MRPFAKIVVRLNGPVPHGTLHSHRYESKALGGQSRGLTIYTPPGYETAYDRRYPVLYLFHGTSGRIVSTRLKGSLASIGVITDGATGGGGGGINVGAIAKMIR